MGEKKVHQDENVETQVEEMSADSTTEEEQEQVATQVEVEEQDTDHQEAAEDLESGEVDTETLIKEKEYLLDRLARLQAEFDNYRRRVNQEKRDLMVRANEKLLLQLLPIIDNFERALITQQERGEDDSGFYKGVEMIYRQVINLLEKEGVTPFDALGEEFDPQLHHAVLREESADDVAEDTVIEVLEKGYMYHQNVLRPAMVKVSE